MSLGSGVEHGGLSDEELWGHLWCFDVVKSPSERAADEAVITFGGLENVPAGAVAYLIDRRLEQLVDVREEAAYTFCMAEAILADSEDGTRFVLLVGSKDFAEEQDLPEPPVITALHQSYPNPFNTSTVIRYDVSLSSHLDLRVYDARGALVRILFSGHRGPGRYEVFWDGSDSCGRQVSSGIYFCRLGAGDGVRRTVKVVLLR